MTRVPGMLVCDLERDVRRHVFQYEIFVLGRFNIKKKNQQTKSFKNIYLFLFFDEF